MCTDSSGTSSLRLFTIIHSPSTSTGSAAEGQKEGGSCEESAKVYPGINTRLQVGTTPGNPILVQQFNNAGNDLEKISTDTAELNQLATAVSSDSTMSAFLSESTRAAFSVSGAVDEDHKQLAILEDEVNRTVVLIERLLKELAEDRMKY